MGTHAHLPRIVIAGLAGDAGKTLVATGLIRALCRRGIRVAPFKKGPDYIDPSWLGAAADCPAKNLDSYLMPDSALLRSIASAELLDLAVIEGNRGIFDGLDAQGSHSTAALAKRLQAPVILVVDASKSTRTVAALVLGCLALDPALPLAGVILNRVGTLRQEQLIREALASSTAVPVLGAIPRLSPGLLPSRHLGLVMPGERVDRDRALDIMTDAVAATVDLEAVVRIAKSAPLLPAPADEAIRPAAAPGLPVRVGILRDEAFCFYYQENLAALEEQGATLLPLSPLHDRQVPPIDALYAGGGYPEEHASALSANTSFRAALADLIACGLPVWAECGGLMYLATTLVVNQQHHPMLGALPIVVEQTARPQGHGYVTAAVDTVNPFFATGTRLRGHEFHHSRVVEMPAEVTTALALDRGCGVGGGRDGIVKGHVFASYLHIFAPGTPEWAEGFVRVAREASQHACGAPQHHTRQPSEARRVSPSRASFSEDSLNPTARGVNRGIDNRRERTD
jgi:cobyrinic acid a,c-diamide synthase